jgi:hypothetical protein
MHIISLAMISETPRPSSQGIRRALTRLQSFFREAMVSVSDFAMILQTPVPTQLALGAPNTTSQDAWYLRADDDTPGPNASFRKAALPNAPGRYAGVERLLMLFFFND